MSARFLGVFTVCAVLLLVVCGMSSTTVVAQPLRASPPKFETAQSGERLWQGWESERGPLPTRPDLSQAP